MVYEAEMAILAALSNTLCTLDLSNKLGSFVLMVHYEESSCLCKAFKFTVEVQNVYNIVHHNRLQNSYRPAFSYH